MALKQGGEQYTMFTIVESGEIKNRRVHRIEIQDKFGKLHVLENDQLPQLISVNTGQGQKGCHIATILLRPEKATSLFSREGAIWPCGRDVLHGFAGMVLWMLMQRLVAIASALP